MATSLDIAVGCGYFHIVQYLIEQGATVNNVAIDFSSLPASYKTENGFIYYDSFGLCSTLDRAIMTKNLDMVNLILSKNPKSVLIKGGKNARTAADKCGDKRIKAAIKHYFDQYDKQYPYQTNKEKYIVIPYSSIEVKLTGDLEKYVK